MGKSHTRSRADCPLAERRGRHLGRLLFELSARFERESLARIRERSLPDLTQSQKQLMVHLPIAGARLTDLAARMGITKQAAMRLVDGLCALGVLTREDDPTDGRAKRVAWTRSGLRRLEDCLAVVEEMESEWRQHLDPRRYEEMHATLIALAFDLGIEMPDDEAKER